MIKIMLCSYLMQISSPKFLFTVCVLALIGTAVFFFKSELKISAMNWLNFKDTLPQLSSQQLAQWQNQGRDILVLDVRKSIEYKTSHLKNAVHIEYSEFNLKWLKERLDSSSKPIVTYCTIGYRSSRTAAKIQEAGLNVYNLYGGLSQWSKKNYPMYDQNNQITKETWSVLGFLKTMF